MPEKIKIPSLNMSNFRNIYFSGSEPAPIFIGKNRGIEIMYFL
jgi:hypothetical protein